MNKDTFSSEHNREHSDSPQLAIPVSDERICTEALPRFDSDSIKRFCQVWGEVGRTILERRRRVKV
jgi:hypothetical protein